MSGTEKQRQGYLGIETGATHTSVLLADAHQKILTRFDLGPANLRLCTDAELSVLFQSIQNQTGSPVSVALGMAGLRTELDRKRVMKIARTVWMKAPVYATSDLETPLAAAGRLQDRFGARVLLLSGTGSCAYGRNREGKTAKFGGRGHILGDQGSACDIALAALRRIVYQHDLKAQFPPLGEVVLRVLQLNDPDDLIPWTQEAEKHEIAQLAMTVFEESRKGDALALEVIIAAAGKLADMAMHCAEQLVDKGSHVQFLLAGSVLLKQRAFAAMVSRRLHDLWPKCRVIRLKKESVWGAVALAEEHSVEEPEQLGGIGVASHQTMKEIVSLASLAEAPTEQRNPKSLHLDTMPLVEAIELMIAENELCIHAIRDQREEIQWTVERIIEAFKTGGRLFYVGAGTSGRLGVLDASECPPTFRVSPDQVQGIIAGGRRAIWSAVEGAEDDYEGGGVTVKNRGLRSGDVLIGIAASGRTPFVWGALHEAKRLGAATVMLAFNPNMKVKAKHQPDKMILVNTGPEVLTGSTRLKAGTATKVILNILTTLAMVHTGKVISNLMIDMNPSNVKLRDRAVRMVREITGRDEAAVTLALEKAHWVVKAAVAALTQA